MTEPVWNGADWLREFLVDLDALPEPPGAASERLATIPQVAATLNGQGQLRPVLLDRDRRIVSRGHLVDAARYLSWTHIAARLEVAELALDPNAPAQASLADLLESGGQTDGLDAFARQRGEADDDDVDAINAESIAGDQWVGLPEFVGVRDPYRVVISCETEADREALFDVLGIATIHKGTRGTLSVWWPDRPKEDLSSLWFGVPDEAEETPTEPEPLIFVRTDPLADDPAPEPATSISQENAAEPDPATASIDELRAYYENVKDDQPTLFGGAT